MKPMPTVTMTPMKAINGVLQAALVSVFGPMGVET